MRIARLGIGILPPIMLRLALVALVALGPVLAQQGPAPITSVQRAKAREMLLAIRGSIRSSYYDPTFRGLDFDAHFRTAESKLATAPTLAAAYAVIAQTLVEFGDSHTYFIPPENRISVEYGWQMAIIGDDCYVVAVKPGSDAEAKGLRPGDRLRQIEGIAPTRRDLWKIRYYFNLLNPRRVIKVVAASPLGDARTLDITATITRLPATVKVDLASLLEGDLRGFEDRSGTQGDRVARIGDVAIWRMASFAVEPDDVDRQFDVVIKGASSLILDMRGNPGGFVKTLERLVGRLFDRDVKIADLKGRKSSKPSIGKTRRTPFAGRIVAIVDSESGSAAEILARVLQIEKRGVVIGDRSAGSVMQGELMNGLLQMPSGPDDLVVMPYAFSVTTADVIMTDGQSLEHTGVVPDELVLSHALDLANGRDPVLARAAAILGLTLDPADAGRMFPAQWR
jgi:C-terminal processing protease CtpA/Prc